METNSKPDPNEQTEQTKKQICSICYNESQILPSMEVSVCEGCYDNSVKYFLEYQKSRKTFYPEIDEIDEHILLGNSDGSRELDLLKTYKVTHILVVGCFLDKYHPEEFTYLQILVNDSVYEDLTIHFEKAIEFMKSAKRVYVHCAAGVSRSSSMVIAYYIKEKGMSYDEAFKFVSKKRKCIYPNSSFVKQLKEFDEKVNGTRKQSISSKVKNFLGI